MPTLILLGVWQYLGYYMILFLAGLQGIPKDLHDAASIDGAGVWHQFWHVTLPLLSPTTFFVLIMAMIESLQVFGSIYMLTGGGPAYATLTLGYHVYENAFTFLNMGYASALAYVLFIVVFLLTLVQFRGQRIWVHY